MTVERIQRIINGRVVQEAARASQLYYKGLYVCHTAGGLGEKAFNSFDEAADFLRCNPGSGIRMNRKWARISRNIYIDGNPLLHV